MSKSRLDILLLKRGHFESREKAKASIMAGLVFVDDVLVDKAGTMVNEDSDIKIKEKMPFCSRGGLKLLKSIETFNLDLNNLICGDFGASTGGFTDCMLQHGAKKVYALDVGYGQLDWKLRNNPRVLNYERTNIRYVDNSIFETKLDFISIDVSFISLNLIFPKVKENLKEGGEVVALVKPQFEAGREDVGKKGIIRDLKVQEKVIKKIISDSKGFGFQSVGLTYSSIKGAKGNIEFLLYLRNIEGEDRVSEEEIKDVVKRAHEELD